MPQPRGLFFTYSDFHRCYQSQLNRLLAPYGMFSTQWSVLKRLYHIEPPTLAELAKVHNVEAPTMTTCVKKLVKLGYVEAAPGDDRRSRNISLTGKGRDVYQETQRLVDTLTAKIQGNIPDAAMDDAISLFITLKKNILQLP